MSTIQAERLSSSDLFVEGPTPARFWGDQWMRVSEKLLKGLNHQLTNRVSSLDAAIALLEVDGPPDVTFVREMTAEIGRLHELLHLYRALTAEPISAPEPIRLQDVMPYVVRLEEHHSDLRHISCQLHGDAQTEPIVVRQTALVRCALVLLASVAGNALRSKLGEPVSVEYGSDADETWLRMQGPSPSGQLLFSGEGSLLHAVRAALAHAHASAEGTIHRGGEADRLEYELRFPTLSALRKTEE